MRGFGIFDLMNYLEVMRMACPPGGRNTPATWLEEPQRKCLLPSCDKLQARGKPCCCTDHMKAYQRLKKGPNQ